MIIFLLFCVVRIYNADVVRIHEVHCNQCFFCISWTICRLWFLIALYGGYELFTHFISKNKT